MGTLYIVGMPAGDPDDLTFRARRILREVTLLAAEHTEHARRLLVHYEIVTPLVTAADISLLLDTLATENVALLSPGWSPGLSGFSRDLVCAASERGLPVVPIPGPALPVTALVTSGLPADSFVYLGELPHAPSARRELLTSIGSERRTLVALALSTHLADTLADLRDSLGDRPLTVVTASDRGTETLWRGTLGEEPEYLAHSSAQARYVLVIGGARELVTRWGEDQLHAEIRACLDQNMGIKDLSHKLAAESGWPRREIYRLAVGIARFSSDQ